MQPENLEDFVNDEKFYLDKKDENVLRWMENIEVANTFITPVAGIVLTVVTLVAVGFTAALIVAAAAVLAGVGLFIIVENAQAVIELKAATRAVRAELMQRRNE